MFEDEHLLVIDKPAGISTHAPAPFAGEGIYDWLRHREPRWASLSILHRLDKETSGVMVFGKTPLANRSLTAQFTQREVLKRYVLLTGRAVKEEEFAVTTALVRAGERYVCRPAHSGSDTAITHFRFEQSMPQGLRWTARPATGRTHQIRAQAAFKGIPILGDSLYGGGAAPRLCLHAASLQFRHPATGQALTFESEPGFSEPTGAGLRRELIDPEETNAFRLIHGASDGHPGWYVERLGPYLLSQSESPLSHGQKAALVRMPHSAGSPAGLYHKTLNRQVRRSTAPEASPELISGTAAPARFEVLENGLRFELSLSEGYSTGLFLDQRDNRRRLLRNHVAAGFPLFEAGAQGRHLLNTFAYTCAFSVCAAAGGMRTTSLDLSKKYLEWGRRNFALNGLELASHDFIYGDVFDWLGRLGRKKRQFDAVMLDPPTFSQSKEHGVFRAEKDYGALLKAALPLVAVRGVLFASTNASRYPAEDFVRAVHAAVQASGRRILQEHYAPQPPDFPISRMEPAHLKTLWLRIS